MLGVRLTHASAAPFISLLTFFSMTPPEGATFATQFIAQIGVQVDALSASFAAAIAFATLIIQAYALTAMRGEAGFRRFFWASSVLGFSTTAFVLSPESLRLTDHVGRSRRRASPCSCRSRGSGRKARVRALRIVVILTAGDVALTLGVVFTWIKFGVFSSLLAAPSGQSLADPFSCDIFSQGVIATLHMPSAAQVRAPSR